MWLWQYVISLSHSVIFVTIIYNIIFYLLAKSKKEIRKLNYKRKVLGQLDGRAKHFKSPGNPKSIV